MTGITVDHKLAVGEVRDTHEHNTQNTHTHCSHTQIVHKHTEARRHLRPGAHPHLQNTLSHRCLTHSLPWLTRGERKMPVHVFLCYRVFFSARLRVILICMSDSPGQRITTKPKRIQLALPSARQEAGRAIHHRTLVKVW